MIVIEGGCQRVVVCTASRPGIAGCAVSSVASAVSGNLLFSKRTAFFKSGLTAAGLLIKDQSTVWRAS
jgi:hypothetical protein